MQILKGVLAFIGSITVTVLVASFIQRALIETGASVDLATAYMLIVSSVGGVLSFFVGLIAYEVL